MFSKSLGKRVFAASLLASAAAVGHAAVEESHFELKSTQDLLVLCGATDVDPNFVAAIYMCRGFLEGTHQYHDAVAAAEGKKRLVCAPDGTTVEEARQVFVVWGGNNSGNAQLMADAPVVGFVRSVVERFPCE